MKTRISSNRGLSSKFIAGLLVIIISALECSAELEAEKGHEIIAFVNGEPVIRIEMQFFGRHRLSEVYQHFFTEHGITDFNDFWSESTIIGEASPLCMLKELAMQDIIKTRILLQLGKDAGFVSETGFSAIMNMREEMNKRRARAVQSGKVIYGPRQYSAEVYFDYFISNLVIRLKEEMGESDYEKRIAREISRVEVQLLRAYDLVAVE